MDQGTRVDEHLLVLGLVVSPAVGVAGRGTALHPTAGFV